MGEQKVRGLFGATDTEDRVGVPGCGPVAFGSFTFDAACRGSVLVVSQAVTGRRAGTSWHTTITAAGADPGPVPAPPAAQTQTRVRWHGSDHVGRAGVR